MPSAQTSPRRQISQEIKVSNRFYMVTFDLEYSANRTNEYKRRPEGDGRPAELPRLHQTSLHRPDIQQCASEFVIEKTANAKR
jgi:hypothetical protein